VLSDFPVSNKLVYMGLEGLWDCAFTSEETQYLKPDSRPFIELAKQLGTEPKNVLYVGNSFKYDVLGAKKAGMYTAYLSKKPAKEADINFTSYTQFQKILAEIL
jgi:putative hydrolase of the HAD superfamily